MVPLSLIAQAATLNPKPSPSPKLVKAARQFEALLLETLVGPMERSFSTLPGESNQAGSDSYKSLGVQTLSEGLTASGGVGIAAMILRSLMKRQGIGSDLRSGELPKVSPASSR
jgi:Rod binding domain-containing protein